MEPAAIWFINKCARLEPQMDSFSNCHVKGRPGDPLGVNYIYTARAESLERPAAQVIIVM